KGVVEWKPVSIFMVKRLVLFLFVISLYACQRHEAKKTDQKASDTTALQENVTEGALSGTFTGTIPCEDCEGIYMALTLNPDQTYHLTEEYIRDRPYPVESLGNWTLREDDDQDRIMLLEKEAEEVRYIEVLNLDNLRVVMGDEEKIENQLDYKLTRVNSTSIEVIE
ncbi:MAG: copper resistance protein NlpE N-terminal domain-containing protein, partial [Rufibacter sp.]